MMHKTLSRVEVKDEDRGEVAAVFSTFDVIDSDNDVTRKGAFTDGAEVVISAYGHDSWSGRLPVGKGTIREIGNEAVMEGRFFLHTTAGADTFKVVKELGGLQEWSYSLHDIQAEQGEHDGKQVRFLNKIRVKEVSPVLMGAGVNTRTLAVKSDMRFGEHTDAVVADVEQLVARAQEVMALRAEKGKAIAPASQAQLKRLVESLDQLRGLLEDQTPSTADTDALAREYARFVSITQGA